MLRSSGARSVRPICVSTSPYWQLLNAHTDVRPYAPADGESDRLLREFSFRLGDRNFKRARFLLDEQSSFVSPHVSEIAVPIRNLKSEAVGDVIGGSAD